MNLAGNIESVETNIGEVLRSTLVVVPTLNEEGHIEACIRSLMSPNLQVSKTKFIVADGGSTDRTTDIVRRLQDEFENLELLDNPARLQSAAINRAVRLHADENHSYLVRCDAHAAYPENFVERVVSKLDETGADSVVIPMDSTGSTCFGRASAWIVDTPFGNGGAAHRAGLHSGYVDHGHHAGFRLEAFRRIGGYDDSFTHNEDAEYDYRLRTSGGMIFMAADIRIDYVVRSTPFALARQYFNYGKGRARTCLKHGIRPRLRQALPIAAFLACLGAFALGPFVPWVLAVPAAYVALLGLASLYISAIRRSPCGLWAGPASGIMHMSWAAGFLVQLCKLGPGKSSK